MRVGGAVGGALFAVILAQRLPSGASQAFQTAFWWLTGASVVALAGSLWLWLALRQTLRNAFRSAVHSAVRA